MGSVPGENYQTRTTLPSRLKHKGIGATGTVSTNVLLLFLKVRIVKKLIRSGLIHLEVILDNRMVSIFQELV